MEHDVRIRTHDSAKTAQCEHASTTPEVKQQSKEIIRTINGESVSDKPKIARLILWYTKGVVLMQFSGDKSKMLNEEYYSDYIPLSSMVNFGIDLLHLLSN
ncbi:hypothetical protein NPIL_483041 [Nephila pilipes]|uniref:Uncharacterized protein n=1 Tax=Nephila pilipes TaxID=299642 RepID=A0A8X6UHZ9_NEPPI|nr:hypothetical protein NPIL_483041 [Nephila pilipes]